MWIHPLLKIDTNKYSTNRTVRKTQWFVLQNVVVCCKVLLCFVKRRLVLWRPTFRTDRTAWRWRPSAGVSVKAEERVTSVSNNVQYLWGPIRLFYSAAGTKLVSLASRRLWSFPVSRKGFWAISLSHDQVTEGITHSAKCWRVKDGVTRGHPESKGGGATKVGTKPDGKQRHEIWGILAG